MPRSKRSRRSTPLAGDPIHGAVYSAAEARKITGASLRQVQWWDETRLYSAARTGTGRPNRIYDDTDLLVIAVILEFRRKGIWPSHFRKWVQAIHDRAKEERYLLATASARELVWIRTERDLFVELQERGLVAVIDLYALRRTLAHRASTLTAL